MPCAHLEPVTGEVLEAERPFSASDGDFLGDIGVTICPPTPVPHTWSSPLQKPQWPLTWVLPPVTWLPSQVPQMPWALSLAPES